MLATPAEVVGREDELRGLREFLEVTPALPAALLLEGEAGIGKTTLWRAAVEAAHRRGYRVLTSTPGASEAALSLIAIRDLLGPMFDEAAAALPLPQRRALAVALLLEEPEGPLPGEGPLAAACLGAICAIARNQPLAVAIDDVQWLDASSASLLEFVARRLRDERIVFLLARRSERDERPPLGLERVLPHDRLRTIRPGGLSLGALHELLRTRLGHSLPRPTLRKLHETSRGNPLYALELARALHARGGELGPGRTLPVPDTLVELVRGRLAGLSDETADALFVVSAVGDATAELIGRVLDRDPSSSLRPALERHLVVSVEDRIRFVHPLFGEVAYAHADAVRRRELHRRLGLVLEDPEGAARHIALSTEPPDPAAADLLDEAARLALARGAPGSAAALFEDARRLTPAEAVDVSAHRGVEAARAHAVAGDARRATALLEELAEQTPRGPARARALAELAWNQASIELCEEAAADAREDIPVGARIDYIRAYVHAFHGDFPVALVAARGAVESAESAADRSLLVLAHSIVGFIEALGCVPGWSAHLELADSLAKATSFVRPYSSPKTTRGRVLLWQDELAEARQCFELQRGRALDLGDEESHALLGLLLAELECRAGDWERARAHAHELAEFFDQGGDETSTRSDFAITHFPRALIAAHTGDLEVARSLAVPAVAAAVSVGWRLWAARNQALVGFIELSQGDHAGAARALDSLGGQVEAMGITDPSVIRFEPDEIEALAGLGRLEEAERRLFGFERRGHELDRPWILATAARCRGLVLAGQGDLLGALESLQASLAAHQRLPVPFERARTLLVLGTVERRAKQQRAARESLEQALAIFDELGARLWAERARAELRRVPGRGRSAGGLTPTERRVAGLVAEGRSNKEVAAALFVTVKTVEANLSRIYAKLGIRSRAELAHRFSSTDVES